MACERNRILELTDYLESCGIEVNIGKNKARGNKGVFKAIGRNFRIDIAKGLSEEAVLRTLAHEFAHFVHYNYDKTLKSLDFIFEADDDLMEELLAITVETIPKSSVQPLFEAKEQLKSDIAALPKNAVLDITLKLKQRALNRINSRISRLNRYYNSPTELFARSFELYIADKDKIKMIAPRVYVSYEKLLKENSIPLLETFVKKSFNFVN